MTTLESKINQPVFENSIEADEEESKVWYVGKMSDFKFYKIVGPTLEVRTDLFKYNSESACLWHVQAGKGYYSFSDGNVGHNGETVVSQEYIPYSDWYTAKIARNYREALIADAANKGIIIKNYLLDLIFKKIEEQALEHFKKVFPNRTRK